MKKKGIILLAVLCVLCLLTACGTKEEEKAKEATPPVQGEAQLTAEPTAAGNNDGLDAVFETGSAELIAAEIPLPDFDTCEIVMPPDSFWDMFTNQYTEADVRDMLKSGFRVATLSPDGKTVVGYVKVTETKTVNIGKNRTSEREVENCILAVVSDGKVTVMYPTDQRGRGELTELIRQDYMGIAGTSWQGPVFGVNGLVFTGFIWSPDGRYFCPLNVCGMQVKMETAGMQASPEARGKAGAEEEEPYSPLAAYAMVDIQTGEMFALDAMARNYKAFWYEIWLNGFFSEDGQYFYAFAKGVKESQQESENPEMEWRIDRYDMNTLEKTVYMSNLPVSTWPLIGMTLLRDGSVFGATERSNGYDPQNYALVRFNADNQTEKVDLGHFFPDNLARVGAVEYVVGSSASGHGLVLVSYFQKGADIPSGLIRVHMDGDIGMEKNTLWVLSAQTRQLEPMAAAEVAEANLAWLASQGGRYGWSGNYLIIYETKLSPDGRYAVVLAVDSTSGEVTAVLVRLSDMKSIPIDSPTLCMSRELGRANPDYGHHLMDWTEAGILITTEETSTLYRFK